MFSLDHPHQDWNLTATIMWFRHLKFQVSRNISKISGTLFTIGQIKRIKTRRCSKPPKIAYSQFLISWQFICLILQENYIGKNKEYIIFICGEKGKILSFHSSLSTLTVSPTAACPVEPLLPLYGHSLGTLPLCADPKD